MPLTWRGWRKCTQMISERRPAHLFFHFLGLISCFLFLPAQLLTQMGILRVEKNIYCHFLYYYLKFNFKHFTLQHHSNLYLTFLSISTSEVPLLHEDLQFSLGVHFLYSLPSEESKGNCHLSL